MTSLVRSFIGAETWERECLAARGPPLSRLAVLVLSFERCCYSHNTGSSVGSIWSLQEGSRKALAKVSHGSGSVQDESFDCQDSMKEEGFRQLFTAFGALTDCSLKFTKDGKFRNFGFIGFKSEEEAQAALNHFNKSFIDTSRITALRPLAFLSGSRSSLCKTLPGASQTAAGPAMGSGSVRESRRRTGLLEPRWHLCCWPGGHLSYRCVSFTAQQQALRTHRWSLSSGALADAGAEFRVVTGSGTLGQLSRTHPGEGGVRKVSWRRRSHKGHPQVFIDMIKRLQPFAEKGKSKMEQHRAEATHSLTPHSVWCGRGGLQGHQCVGGFGLERSGSGFILSALLALGPPCLLLPGRFSQTSGVCLTVTGDPRSTGIVGSLPENSPGLSDLAEGKLPVGG
ncbi:Hypothetical predicted protein [Marmota monax]|uniref:RRM domain-containing protein n=1 Tax=Marmota monax TaxID=9995 RepID=A0A5E4D1Q7_MARMO|nr:Hypothetical predicted protein [Marmota monax]